MAANKTEKEYGEEENLKNREVDANKILNFHVSANIFLATLASWLYGGGSIGPSVQSFGPDSNVSTAIGTCCHGI